MLLYNNLPYKFTYIINSLYLTIYNYSSIRYIRIILVKLLVKNTILPGNILLNTIILKQVDIFIRNCKKLGS